MKIKVWGLIVLHHLHRLWWLMNERWKRCQHCGCWGAERYRQNTCYVDEEHNWVTLCPPCQEANDEYWADMWSDYYSGLL